MRASIAGVLAVVLAACVYTGATPRKDPLCLAVRQFPGGGMLERRPLPIEGRFALTFIHSVSKTPVKDDYRVTGGKIVQIAESFEAHGAGLPSGTEEPGVTGWEHCNGRFIIRMERPISRLIVRTDRDYRNRLLIEGTEINLNRWPNQALELVVGPCS